MRASSARLAAFVLVALIAPTPGRAEEPAGAQRVAVLRLTFEGTVPEAARTLFNGRLAQGLTAAQFGVISDRSVETKLAATPNLAGCKEPSCYPQVSRTLGVSYLVVGRVEAHNKNYEISLELINGRTGVTLGTNRESCVICGIEEAAEKTELAATALRSRLELVVQQPARFIIRSRPAGAAVTLDGRPRGKTPVDIELRGGPHQLKLQAGGYGPVAHSFTAVAGIDETIDLELVPLPTRFPYRTAGYAALALGITALAAGIWATVADGRIKSCTAQQRDNDGDCPSVWDTRAISPFLLAGGGALTAMGGMWLWIARTGKGQPGFESPAAGSAAPTSADAGGLVLGVGGAF